MFSVNVEKYIRFLFKAILVPRILHCFFQPSCALPRMLHFPISISGNFLGKHLCMGDIAQCRGNSSFEKFRSVAIALWQYDQKMNGRDQLILSNVISHMSSRWVNLGVRVTKRAIIFVRTVKRYFALEIWQLRSPFIFCDADAEKLYLEWRVLNLQFGNTANVCT